MKTLKEFIDELNHLIKENPEAATYTVVTSSDDEGNSYREVYFSASVGYFDKDDEFFWHDDNATNEGYKHNSVCIN